MRRHELAGLDGAHFPGSVVADGKYEIHFIRIISGEFVPVLRPDAIARKALVFQKIEGIWMDLSGRVTAGAETGKSALPLSFQHALRDDDAHGISFTEKGNFVCHARPPDTS